MNRGGRGTIARRVMAATVMLGLGVAVIGGGVAMAGVDPGSGAPAVTVPGVVSDYQVVTPTATFLPVAPDGTIDPAAPDGAVVTADEWGWE